MRAKRNSDKKNKLQFKKKSYNRTIIEDEKPLKRSMLINTAVVTVRNPSKETEALCKNLRKILSPDCLSKMETNPKMQDLADVAHQLLVKQIIYISENHLKIASLPNGPTYVFEIVSKENTFKNFSPEYYSTIPFLTFEGKSPIKPIFQSFGQSSSIDFKRVIHFHFKEELIYIRHFFKTVEDTDDNFRVHLKEIGPKITLKFIEKITGVLPDLNIKLKFRSKFSDERDGE